MARGKTTFKSKNHLLTTNIIGLDTKKTFLKIYIECEIIRV